MEKFTLKSVFIYDSTLKSNKKKPSDDEMQDIKLLYYYPDNEEKVVKRSNMGIIEGTMSFLDAFELSDGDKFMLVEMSSFYYISNTFDDNKSIGMILNKQSNSEFKYNQNVETKKKWLKSFLNNFYEMFIFYNGPIHKLFFNDNNDIRNDEEKYKSLIKYIDDFILNYFEALPLIKIPFIDNILYFPLNESYHIQMVMATQRLKEKIPEIKYTSLLFRGYLMHNEAPLDSVSLIFNSFYNNIDASAKYNNFTRPPLKVVQTVNITNEPEQVEINTSSAYRKSFELVGFSNYLVGLSKININNYHVFIPKVYFRSTDEYLKMIVYFYNGLIIFLFLNENFNPQIKINQLIKIDRWVTRYFDDQIKSLENLYQQKSNKYDNATFAYLNNINKSVKLSSTFYNRKFKTFEKDKLDLLLNLLRINYDVQHSSLTKIKGYYIYYLSTLERKVVIILPEILSLPGVKSSIEEIKKDLFDHIFIL